MEVGYCATVGKGTYGQEKAQWEQCRIRNLLVLTYKIPKQAHPEPSQSHLKSSEVCAQSVLRGVVPILEELMNLPDHEMPSCMVVDWGIDTGGDSVFASCIACLEQWMTEKD